jgi:hypothetical protein
MRRREERRTWRQKETAGSAPHRKLYFPEARMSEALRETCTCTGTGWRPACRKEQLCCRSLTLTAAILPRTCCHLRGAALL